MSILSRHCWSSSRGMPEPRNLNYLLLVIDPINDSIRAVNQLPKRPDSKLWHDTANLSVIFELPGMRHQFVAEARRGHGVVARNVRHNFGQISLSRSRQDYLVAHLSIFFSTSSSDTTSPRSISSNPFRTPAINSMRSRISSNVDSSGSR